MATNVASPPYCCVASFWVRLTLLTAPDAAPERIAAMMTRYADPEEWEEAMAAADAKRRERDKAGIVIFDALYGFALNWSRLRELTDALLQPHGACAASVPSTQHCGFGRIESDEFGLVIELPKMLAGAATLRWTKTNLYGMLFARLAMSGAVTKRALNQLMNEADLPSAPDDFHALRRWPLSHSRSAQLRAFELLAARTWGGRTKKAELNWPARPLADGHGEVTRRSFIVLIKADVAFNHRLRAGDRCQGHQIRFAGGL